MSFSAPKPPNYQAAAEKTAQANRPDVNSPFATQNWTRGPNGEWTLNTGFSEPLQGVFDSLVGDISKGTKGLEDSLYEGSMSRLNPEFANREEAVRTQLANQGLDPNSEAGRGALFQLGQQRNDAFSGARQQAASMAGQEQARRLGALFGLRGLIEAPNFNAGPNYLGAAGMQGQADMDRWAAQNKIWTDLISGGVQAGTTAAIAASDERLKTDIVRHKEEALPGVPFASWRYRHAPDQVHTGVIAQDLERVAPEYVFTRGDGLKFVDYSFLEGRRAA